MKVGIDVSPIIYQTGVSNYIKNLVAAQVQAASGIEFTLFGGSLRRKAELDEFINKLKVRGKTFYLPPKLLSVLWNNLHIFPVDLLIGKVDVFHSSDWTQPPTKAKKVTTIHDLVPLRFPEVSDPAVVSAHKARLSWVKKEADKVIAVSEFTKQEIVEVLQVEPERIVVIPEAPDPFAKKPSLRQITKVKKKHRINKDYLLIVGADPRKNIPAILQAFRQLKGRKSLTLVIVGRPWEPIPSAPGVRQLGHITKEDLTSLYAGAQALVYTSLYEGFGLPILEAMQQDCPIVTSNISSMPEVAGDAAVLVDPTNPSHIAEGIEKVLSDRQNWIKKGRARVKQFSWEKAAKETIEVYKEVVNK